MAVIPGNVRHQAPSAASDRHRRCWLPELLVLTGIALLSTAVFWLTPLDLVVSEWFRTAKDGIAWPIAQHQPWLFLNRKGDTWLTVVLISLPVLVLAGGLFISRCRTWRRYALFVLATVILGPGLLVNVGFKEHLGRPRPTKVEDFGGIHAYVPPLHIGRAGNNSSFPSGHAASAFCYFSLWFVWRRRYPRLALAAFTGTLMLGGIMSFSRVAAGAHFLSDVLWSAYLCYFSSFILYYFILRIPLHEDEDVKETRKPAF
jgi:membrane-associated PAP2 superfamily phosphatase